MPRLTTARYLQAHHRLRKLWLKDHGLFTELDPVEQWMLHNFFCPNLDLPDAVLIAHRTRITAERPGLPQQAGKALAEFERSLKRPPTVTAPPVPGIPKSRQFTLRPIVNPETDAKKLARIFLTLAAHLNEQQGSGPRTEAKADDEVHPRSRP